MSKHGVVAGSNLQELEKVLGEVKSSLLGSLEGKIAPEKLQRLAADMERTITDLRRDGPMKTSLKGIIRVIKEANEQTDKLPEALMALARGEESGGKIFILGGLYADLISARGLLETVRARLLDVLEELPARLLDVLEELPEYKPEDEKKPE